MGKWITNRPPTPEEVARQDGIFLITVVLPPPLSKPAPILPDPKTKSKMPPIVEEETRACGLSRRTMGSHGMIWADVDRPIDEESETAGMYGEYQRIKEKVIAWQAIDTDKPYEGKYPKGVE